MSELSIIITMILEGLFGILNNIVGLFLGLSIFNIPLLVYLATFDLIRFLLQSLLGVETDDDIDDNEPSVISGFNEDIQLSEIDTVLDIKKEEYVKRTKRSVSPNVERRLLKEIYDMYGISEDDL